MPDADLRELPDTACPQEGYAPLSSADLESLVAPIALYPDELVAQVLGAAGYPEQITEAHDWLQWNSGLQGQALMWGDPRSTINHETHVSVKCVSPSKNSLQEQARRWRRWWRRERQTRRSSGRPTWAGADNSEFDNLIDWHSPECRLYCLCYSFPPKDRRCH